VRIWKEATNTYFSRGETEQNNKTSENNLFADTAQDSKATSNATLLDKEIKGPTCSFLMTVTVNLPSPIRMLLLLLKQISHLPAPQSLMG
jgi:hypothetical protein